MKNYIKLYDNDPHYIYHAVNVTQVENLPSNSIAELHQRMNQNRSIFQSLQSRETVGNRRTSAHHIHGQQFGLNSSSISSHLYPYLSSLTSCKLNEPAIGEATYNMQFSPDGKILVCCQQDSKVKLVDTNTKRHISTLTSHTGAVNTACFITDKMFATGSEDNTVKAWDLRYTAEHVMSLEGHTSWIKNIDLLDESRILTAAFDGSIRLWNLQGLTDAGPGVSAIVRDNKVIVRAPELLRARLLPDKKTLTFSLRSNELFKISNLDVNQAPVHIFPHEIDNLVSRTEYKMRSSPDAVNQTINLPLPRSMLRRTNRLELFAESQITFSSSLQSPFHPLYHPSPSTSFPNEERKGWLLVRGHFEDEEADSMNEQCVLYDCLAPNHTIDEIAEDMENEIEKEQDQSTVPSTNKYSFLQHAIDIIQCPVHLPSLPSRSLRPLRSLLHFMDASTTHEVIKGPCFTPCSNFIVSPYYSGIRLFKIPDDCSRRKDDEEELAKAKQRRKEKRAEVTDNRKRRNASQSSNSTSSIKRSRQTQFLPSTSSNSSSAASTSSSSAARLMQFLRGARIRQEQRQQEREEEKHNQHHDDDSDDEEAEHEYIPQSYLQNNDDDNNYDSDDQNEQPVEIDGFDFLSGLNVPLIVNGDDDSSDSEPDSDDDFAEMSPDESNSYFQAKFAIHSQWHCRELTDAEHYYVPPHCTIFSTSTLPLLTPLVMSGSASHLVNTHSDTVLTVRACPTYPMIVSAGMDGTVNFYQPEL